MTDGPAAGSRWSDDEFRASISAYEQMLRAEHIGQPLVKSDAIADLNRVVRRTRSSLDYRMRNISAVLDELGLEWIDGYKPMRNYPRRLKELLEAEWQIQPGPSGRS